MTGRYFFSVILLICVATAAVQDEYLCPYTFITKTGIQAANATHGAQVDLIFNYKNDTDLQVISNICTHSVQGADVECFRNDTLDVFFFDGPCHHYCDVVLIFNASIANSWTVDFFILGASFPKSPCDFRIRYDVNKTLQVPNASYPFDFCNTTGAVGTEKQKLTEASLLRLFGMPSYST